MPAPGTNLTTGDVCSLVATGDKPTWPDLLNRDRLLVLFGGYAWANLPEEMIAQRVALWGTGAMIKGLHPDEAANAGPRGHALQSCAGDSFPDFS